MDLFGGFVAAAGLDFEIAERLADFAVAAFVADVGDSFCTIVVPGGLECAALRFFLFQSIACHFWLLLPACRANILRARLGGKSAKRRGFGVPRIFLLEGLPACAFFGHFLDDVMRQRSTLPCA